MYPPIELRLFTRPYKIDPILKVFVVDYLNDNYHSGYAIEHEDLILICNEDLKLSVELTEWDQTQLESIEVLNEGTHFQQLLTGINLFEILPEDTYFTDYTDDVGLNLTF